jgi:hypothetical protein
LTAYYLLNSVVIGGPKLVKAGTLISTPTPVSAADVAGIEAAGGQLWPATDTVVAAAAVIAQKYNVRGDGEKAGSVMFAAALQSLAGGSGGGGGGGGGVIGTTTIGTSLFGEAGSDWGAVPAGQTATVFLLSLPQLQLGEQITIACLVDVQSVAPAQAISGATNASPIVCTMPSTAAYQTGSMANIAGGLGNTAVNGPQTVTVLTPTTLSLNGTTGNGAYSGGAVLNPLDFGHFERRATFRNMYGVVLNAQGGTTDTDLTNPGGPFNNVFPSLVGTVAKLSVVGNTVQVIVTAPTNTPVRAAVSVSYVRRPLSGPLGSAPVVTTTTAATGPSAGGTPLVLRGEFFTGTTQVTVCGVPASFSFVDDATLSVTTNQYVGLGGVGDIVVTNANGSGTLLASFAYVPDSFAIFGAVSHVWKGSALTQSAGVVTGCGDQNVANPIVATVTGAPAYNASSATWTPAQPSATLVSTHPDTFTMAAVPVGAGNSLFGWVIDKQVETATHSASLVITIYSFFGLLMNSSGQYEAYAGGRAAAVQAAVITGQKHLKTLFSDALGVGSGGQSSAAIDNDAAVTVAGTNSTATPATTTVYFGGSGPGTFPYSGEVVEWGLCPFASGTSPSGAQLAALHAYATRICGTP